MNGKFPDVVISKQAQSSREQKYRDAVLRFDSLWVFISFLNFSLYYYQYYYSVPKLLYSTIQTILFSFHHTSLFVFSKNIFIPFCHLLCLFLLYLSSLFKINETVQYSLRMYKINCFFPYAIYLLLVVSVARKSMLRKKTQ